MLQTTAHFAKWSITVGIDELTSAIPKELHYGAIWSNIEERITNMSNCVECKYCQSELICGKITRFCCADGNINYTPSLVYEQKPEWCKFEEKDNTKG